MTRPLVSICLPVRNSANRIRSVVDSVLNQDYENFELVISDNASTDDTEIVCRQLADGDDRIRYHRQAENIGLLPNFISAANLAHGEFVRWIGHDDQLLPNFISSSLAEFEKDDRLLIVTSQVSFENEDGSSETVRYD